MATENIGIKLSASGAQAVVADINKVATVLGRVEGVAGLARTALGTIGVGFSIGGVLVGLNRIVDGIDKLNDAADATGANIDKIAGLERLARINGQSLDTVTTSLVKLNQAINASDGADSKAALALKAIGLNADELKKLDPADALLEVSKALDRFADDGDKARIVQVLFGKSLREVAPLLNDLRTQQENYAISAKQAAAEAEAFRKNVGALTASLDSLGRTVAGPLVENLNRVFTLFGRAPSAVELETRIRKLTESLSALSSTDAPGIKARLEGNLRQALAQYSQLVPSNSNAPSLAGALDNEEAKVEAAKKLAAAREKAADAAKKQAEAEAKLRADIQIDLADQRLLLDLLQRGLPIEEARLRIQLARKGATGEEIESIVTATNATKSYTDQLEAEKKAREDLIEATVNARKAASEEAADLESQVVAERARTEALGLTGIALAQLEAARLRDAAAEKERIVAQAVGLDPAIAEEYLRQAAALRELADARVAGAVKQDDIEKAREAIEVQQREARELQKIFDDIGRSLTDSLFRGFESGKGFAKSLRDSVVNIFKTTLIRIPLQGVLTGIVSAIGGAFGLSGAAQASGLVGGSGGFGGGFLSALSGGKTIFDALSGSLTNSITGFATQLGSLGFNSGAQFFNGFASALNGGSAATFSGASAAYNFGNFAGQAAPFLPAVFSLLQGDVKGAAFSAGGAAIGSFFGGPIGGAIGGAIGSLIGGLFGGGAKTYRNRLSGSTERGFTFNNTRGGIKGGNDALVSIATGFTDQVKALAGVLGTDVGEILVNAGLKVRGKKSFAGFSATVNGESFSTSVGNAKRSPADTLKLLADQVQELVRTAVLSVSKASLTKTMDEFLRSVKIADFQAAVGKVAQLIELQGLLANKFAANADNIIKTGNIDGSLAALQALLTPQEVVTQQTETLTAAFAKLGFALPKTVEQLREYVYGIDKSTEAGQELFNKILALVQPFLQLAQSLGSVDSAIAEKDLLAAKFRATVDNVIKTANVDASLAALNALLTPQEVVDEQTRQLTKAFGELGFALPGSVEQLREYVYGIDKSTEAGQELFNKILALVQPFLQLSQAMQAVNQAAEAQRQAQLSAADAYSKSRDDALQRLAVVQSGGALTLPQPGGLPGFASGGDFRGGLALVGERGPEIIATGPARVFNAGQTSAMLAGEDTTDEVRALRQDLRDSQAQVAALLMRVNKLFSRWDVDGLPETRAVA